MDDADRADREVERTLNEALRNARIVRGPLPRGECLWCEEPLEGLQRWCGPACRDEWEAHSVRG